MFSFSIYLSVYIVLLCVQHRKILPGDSVIDSLHHMLPAVTRIRFMIKQRDGAGDQTPLAENAVILKRYISRFRIQ